MLHCLAITLLPRQGHLFQTTSIGRRKALKNVHLYTCSPCAKRHINIVTLLVDIWYVLFFLWNYFLLRHNHLGTPVTCPVVQQYCSGTFAAPPTSWTCSDKRHAQQNMSLERHQLQSKKYDGLQSSAPYLPSYSVKSILMTHCYVN